MYWSIHLSSRRRDRVCLETRSVLVKEAWFAREPLRIRAEELAVLVDGEDINVVTKLGGETTAFGVVSLLPPVNPEFPDLTAGDSLAG